MRHILGLIALVGFGLTGCTYSLQQSCYSDGTEQTAETPKTVTPTTDVKIPAELAP